MRNLVSPSCRLVCICLSLLLFHFGKARLLAHPPDSAHCCVWRVTNAPAPFYLVGTIHALSGRDYPLPKPYEQTLHDSQRLLFELDPNPKSEFGRELTKAAVYPKGDMIERHLHPGAWKYLEKNFRASDYLGDKQWRWEGFHFESIDRLRPWAIAYFIWGVRGYSNIYDEYGVDYHLSYQARRLGKWTGGLETDQEHIRVLSGMNDIESELILLDALVRGDKRRDDYNAIRNAWRCGDTATLWALESRFRNESPGASVRLLDERNVKWIPRIHPEMKSGKGTAIVAGCLHFCGPNGIVQILQREGCKVEQL